MRFTAESQRTQRRDWRLEIGDLGFELTTDFTD
jgi:hypothetical protein